MNGRHYYITQAITTLATSQHTRSTPTCRKRIDPRNPPPPTLVRAYTAAILRKAPGAEGHRDEAVPKMRLDTANEDAAEQEVSPAVIKAKPKTQESFPPLTFQRLPPSSYINSGVFWFGVCSSSACLSLSLESNESWGAEDLN